MLPTVNEPAVQQQIKHTADSYYIVVECKNAGLKGFLLFYQSLLKELPSAPIKNVKRSFGLQQMLFGKPCKAKLTLCAWRQLNCILVSHI